MAGMSARGVGIKPDGLPFITSGLTIIDGTAFDEDGCGPYPHVKACPNCGKGGGYLDPLTYFGMLNSGRHLDGCCSRRCLLQWEYAGRRAVEAGAA